MVMHTDNSGSYVRVTPHLLVLPKADQSRVEKILHEAHGRISPLENSAYLVQNFPEAAQLQLQQHARVYDHPLSRAEMDRIRNSHGAAGVQAARMWNRYLSKQDGDY